MKQILAVFLFAVVITFTVYWKMPLQGKVPFPGDLLVGRFFPFNTMSWEGYPAGVPYKEFINADVVRQLFPWRDLAIELMKQGEMPWWNPYAFTGSPLLANVQSAPFYPLNLLYFMMDHRSAWIVGVVLQPILAIVWMWLFAREVGMSRAPALFSALAFAFMGYMVIWFELNTVGHAALWLPLILWGIERWRKRGQNQYLMAIVFGSAASFLAGHLQTTIYVMIVVLTFAMVTLRTKVRHTRQPVYPVILSLFAALVLSAGQLLPAMRFISHTPRGTQADEEIFNHFLLPTKHLVTFIAHDYFGNPAVGNFWGTDYGEFMGYFGVVAILFALMGVRNLTSRIRRWLAMLAVVSLLFALPSPLSRALQMLKVPILSTSAPSRTLFIVQFVGAMLAGFGMQDWLKRKSMGQPVALLGGAFALAWAAALAGYLSAGDPATLSNWKVTLRNLIPPSAVFLASATITLMYPSKGGETRRFASKAVLVVLFLLASAEYSYFANKFQTFSEPRFFFPQTPIYEFLTKNSRESPDRFFGDYTASVTSNSFLPYRIYGVEGYDSLYIGRYGELLAAAEDGTLPEYIPRSDANLFKNRDDLRRRRLQDLLGVRYILDKNDNPRGNWEPDPHRFPPERYQLIWQDGKFKVYENSESLPRAFLVGSYGVENEPQAIIDLLFKDDFNLESTLILEEEMDQAVSPSKGNIEFTRYTPSEVVLRVQTPTPQLLFLSDAFYPDWQASVDGALSRIFRADYAFRAVLVPEGSHEVRFFYKASFL